MLKGMRRDQGVGRQVAPRADGGEQVEKDVKGG